ncbi:acyl-CoA-binding domain-containing protein 5 isoform X3 [Diaphorina citri]|uniref:Acyl-CoA-binding domain-containing protein 5 isoform X1 n=1 Tax=Diaphorina citri TaxID=121845 RepID=A0A1S3D570_DIACI|nr:acyl-CoA-binding domain-containing protein 5 isoform X1 [Diaphorina citri]XP_026680573.1 acyl-CoA-binding domain-containing protein 5 isoform X2 [Diaphorina citri]XP_026680574.1 acyl-CoA-binding domain-containing protein 5 isoform X3 [Diaphorina citri]XP_026680575.1 acyl-CoA-binding domain-containing protein 5 isoform X3 [Diaphorina citri]XP_026680576.1 acyl-CoA-binding domain-containing protein 5 isoform X3 [Diaphorina citri]XP_026680577.1 acyl-CoA-binding domain-containing protein 5 isofo
MTTEEKFHAAVNVIRNLPKNGAYQPSNDLMLRFYSYFKQATEGPCKQPKPSFWDVVRKAKWDAWKKLGNMGKEEAMEAYVEELKKIVETMAYNDNVETFMGSLDSFYENVPAEELDMILGPVIERVRSQPGSPLNKSPLGSPHEKSPLVSRDASPSRTALNGIKTNGTASKPASKFYTTLDDQVVERGKKYTELASTGVNSSPGHNSSGVLKPKTVLLDSLSDNIRNIQTDLASISERIKRLEVLSKLLAVQRSENSAWSLIRNNVPLVTFLVLWPILTQLMSLWIQTRRRQSR